MPDLRLIDLTVVYPGKMPVRCKKTNSDKKTKQEYRTWDMGKAIIPSVPSS